MKIIELKKLSFRYSGEDKEVLSDIDLAIEEGGFYVICGASGSGKSTLLRQLKTSLQPVGQRSGRILYYGRDLEEVSQYTQSAKIGFVFQNPDTQIVTDKVWHELAFGLESIGMPQDMIRVRVAEMASYFGIQNWFYQSTDTLSGGQKQLLNLASVMVMHPKVLLLDEPVSQLDPIAAADFMATVHKLHAEFGITVIMAEHSLEEVAAYVDEVIFMKEGRLIAVRTHTRFVYFPSHRHNFVEVLYVCEGSLTNIIDGKKVIVNKGELLFLNQFTKHEILKAGQNDIAINFMVLPEFFDVAYSMAGNDNMLADFLVNVLRQDEERGEYLHFKVAEVLQIQNLLENMIYSLVTGKGDQNRINQTTMGLIFLYLLESVQYAEMRLPNQYENMITMTTLDYIEQQYKTATLTELCEKLHLPMHMLSKMIRKNTGFNFKELLQRKRLNKSVELMCETDLPISDIIAAVGYENGSYFHRVFKERYHTTPRAFRVANGKEERVRL